jgi:hypothetical protein
MRTELSYIRLVIYVFDGLFAIETVTWIFMLYCNVTVIVVNYTHPPAWEANIHSAGQYILCVFKIKG